MVELNHRERSIKIKIVYYGPAVGGKTTNLQVLHQHALASRRGEMVSINSAQDRTILFDLLPLRSAGFRGFDLQIQLLAVPGQAMYSATRRLVLKGADAVVFVANSAADRWNENIQSFREMTQTLIAYQLDPASMPLVLQYNKRDLPEVTEVDIMDRALNARKVDALPAVAVRGEGVLETFTAILMRTMKDISSRYQILDAIKGLTLAQWAQQTVAGMFGTTSLAIEPNPVEAQLTPPPAPAEPAPLMDPWGPPERRTIRVTLPKETAQTAGPDARANETLVDTYAQASEQLSTSLGEVREERDVARRRLEDILQTLNAAQDLLSGQPLEPTLRGVLVRMGEAASTNYASFLVPEGERALRAASLRGLRTEPLLSTASGQRYAESRLKGDSEPRVHAVSDHLDLVDTLEGQDPPFGAVITVPFRTPRGLQGLAALYLTQDAAIPKAEVLGHLAILSRALSSSLELARVLETVRSAEKNLQLALAGTASIRGLDEILAFLEELRSRLGEMRSRKDAPLFFLEQFANLAPSLAGALTTARSLAAFCKGEIQREPVELSELLTEMNLAEHTIGAGADRVSGDAVLLRLAIRAILDEVGGSGDQVQVRASAEGGLVRLSLEGSAPSGGASRASYEATLTFVRRIAELHGGALSLEGGSLETTRYTLSLVPG